MTEWSPLEERAAIVQFDAHAKPIDRALALSIAQRQQERREWERAHPQVDLFPVPVGVRR